MDVLFRKISKKLLRLRLCPIKVFCFHIISESFDSQTMWECDWMQTDRFKSLVDRLSRGGYRFISLTDAYKHIANDWCRFKKYAVFTFDDGSKTILELMPWLAERMIPITLFVNPAFLSGNAKREKPMALMREDELKHFVEQYSSLVTLASHSYKHEDVSLFSEEMFQKDVLCCEDYLNSLPGKIPFYAYPYGRFTKLTNDILRKVNLIPVLVDGQDNFGDNRFIHRVLP